MDFKKNYHELIAKAKSENRDKSSGVYYEQHHIVPRSLGGPDTASNLILLTPQEHYMAHYYLWKFTDSKEMACAFWFMSIHKSEGVQEIISPDEYAQLREDAAEASRERQEKPVYCLELDMDFPSCKKAAVYVSGSPHGSENIGMCCNKQITAAFEWKDGLRYHWCWIAEKEEFKKQKEKLLYEEVHRREITNQHISEAKKGSVPWNKGIECSEETKQKISEANKGRVSTFKGKHHSEESKRKLSESHKGKTTWNKGISMSEETKKKLSAAKGIKVKCAETGQIFNSGKDAALFLGVAPSTGSYIITQAKAGKPYKGYHFEIITEEK